MSNLNPGGLTRVLNYIKTWVTGLLNGKANSSHTHTKSQITDFPAYGSTAGTICQGNDSRLSDARTPYFANGTWYSVGDDVAIGDHNVGGGLGVKSLNNATTRIDLCYKDDASNYKSITYDGTTLYMNGNCNYANSAGSVAWSNVTGKPTIPTKTSDLTNNSGFLTSHNPIDSSLSSTSTNAVQNKVVKSALDSKLAINTGSGIIERAGWGQYLYCQIATITIIGSYVNNPIVLEISGRGILFSTVQILFENTSSTDPTISKFISDNYNYFYIKKTATSTWAVYVKYTEEWGNVTVHRASGNGLALTAVSCNFTASDLSELPSGCTQVSSSLATVATSGSYNDLSNKPTIPTNTNQLTNGAGFITSSGSCNYANSAGSASSTSSVSFSNNGQCYINAGGADCGDAIDSQACNLAIRSWWSIGFYDQCLSKYAISMDVRNGIVRAYTLRAENSSDKGLQLGSYHLYVG